MRPTSPRKRAVPFTSMRTALRSSWGTVLCSQPMDLFETLMLWLSPVGLVVAGVVFYCCYAVVRIAWDVLRAFTTFD